MFGRFLVFILLFAPALFTFTGAAVNLYAFYNPLLAVQNYMILFGCSLSVISLAALTLTYDLQARYVFLAGSGSRGRFIRYLAVNFLAIMAAFALAAASLYHGYTNVNESLAAFALLSCTLLWLSGRYVIFRSGNPSRLSEAAGG